jgi:hypothetical protein
MAKEVHVNMLRIFDWKDGCFFGICRSYDALHMLTFMEDGAGPWCEECTAETSVLVDCSEPIQFSEPKELRLAAAWLFAAAAWLESRQAEIGGHDGQPDSF